MGLLEKDGKDAQENFIGLLSFYGSAARYCGYHPLSAKEKCYDKQCIKGNHFLVWDENCQGWHLEEAEICVSLQRNAHTFL